MAVAVAQGAVAEVSGEESEEVLERRVQALVPAEDMVAVQMEDTAAV